MALVLKGWNGICKTITTKSPGHPSIPLSLFDNNYFNDTAIKIKEKMRKSEDTFPRLFMMSLVFHE